MVFLATSASSVGELCRHGCSTWAAGASTLLRLCRWQDYRQACQVWSPGHHHAAFAITFSTSVRAQPAALTFICVGWHVLYCPTAALLMVARRGRRRNTAGAMAQIALTAVTLWGRLWVVSLWKIPTRTTIWPPLDRCSAYLRRRSSPVRVLLPARAQWLWLQGALSADTVAASLVAVPAIATFHFNRFLGSERR